LGGGFIFQIDDFRVDASVAGQLEKIRRQLASI
jgi:F0F1-type ATP synthase delta subunit